MRLASIDIGSNTVRLLVADCVDGVLRPVRHERKVTRMAGGMHLSGDISDRALGETAETVRDYGKIAMQEGARRIEVAGTSALRDASNSAMAVKEIERISGLSVRIISGEQEAQTMCAGALSGLDHRGRAVIIDIGGGSTEIISVESGHVTASMSFPLGVVRMMEESVHDDPPSSGDIERLDRQSRSFALNARAAMEGHYTLEDTTLIGTAGTSTTLASLDMELEKYDWRRVQGHVLSLETIGGIERRILAVPLEIRRQIKGMEAERADLIIAGTRLTIRTMEALGFGNITVSDHGLLEGLIVDMCREAGQ